MIRPSRRTRHVKSLTAGDVAVGAVVDEDAEWAWAEGVDVGEGVVSRFGKNRLHAQARRCSLVGHNQSIKDFDCA